jgi:hypothetical protein
MSDEPAPKSSDIDVLRYMHEIASKYHLHYSTVRSTASSLFLAIGMLTSVLLLINKTEVGRGFPSIFIVFVFITTIGFNLLFSKWSRACRQLERYYEIKMGANTSYTSRTHGFRHIFRQLILLKEYPNPPPQDFPPPNLSWNIDEFVIGVTIFGGFYAGLYLLFIWLY